MQLEDKMPKENKDKYVLGKVATQEEVVIQDTETNEIISVNGLLIKIANDIEAIKKNIA